MQYFEVSRGELEYARSAHGAKGVTALGSGDAIFDMSAGFSLPEMGFDGLLPCSRHLRDSSV
jgi:hypothetical protein